MITEELWDEIKKEHSEELWKLVKDLTREVRRVGLLDRYRGLICNLLEILDLNRQIQKLEAEREVVNRLLAPPKGD